MAVLTSPVVSPYLTRPLPNPSMTEPFSAASQQIFGTLVEQALYHLLAVNPRVAALISGRVYSPVLPQTVTYPAIAFRLVGTERITQVGERGSTGLARSQFAIFAASQGPSKLGEAKRLDLAVRLAIQGYRGQVLDSLLEADIYFQNVIPIRSYDFYDDTTQTHQAVSIYDIWASEQQPDPL